MKHLLFLIFAVQACLPGFAACDGRVRIVPRPAEVEELPGSFRLTPRTPVVITDEQLRTPAEIFARAVGKLTGTEPAVTAAPEKHAVTLQLQPGYEAEEYLLEVGRQRITVTASTPQAVLHGLRSLQQLVAGGEIPACVVRDKPTFAYRGAMLDVCRHFFPVEDVKTYIDILSLHKINKFHWHLTDDQGWRIEIKKYPLLTQIGSRRAETLVGRYDKNKEGVYDGKPYGGFYTQEEIREIVSYAAERHIEVIPEIEMPGHGLAALTAYPWLGCTGGPYAVWTHWGISDDVYCAGKETTFEFIEKVLTEVLALFPSTSVPKDAGRRAPSASSASARRGSRTNTSCRATSSTASNAGCIPTAGRSSVGTKSSRAAFRKPRTSCRGTEATPESRPHSGETR